MKGLSDFFISNYILICVCLVMATTAILRLRQHRRTSILIIAIVASTIVLAVCDFCQFYTKADGNYWGTMFLSFFGYILKPACLYLFILLSNSRLSKKKQFLLLIPMVITVIIYIFALIPATSDYVYTFKPGKDGIDLSLYFYGGPLRFIVHIAAALYLGYLLYASVVRLKVKHYWESATIMICAAVIIVAVIIETFFNPNGDILILNPSIAVSTMTYYLYLYVESAKYDKMTGLFNRETYYMDLPRMDKSMTAVIQFDMNGLKYINDNFGHQEGDKALRTIASVIAESIDWHMYGYRLGGDEFIVLANGSSEEKIIEVIKTVKAKLAKTPYNCSIGYAYRSDKSITPGKLFRLAEKAMYADKDEFYKTSEIKRRRGEDE